MSTGLKQLIEQCQRGNSFAQRRLFDQYARRLYRVCVRYVHDEPVAEEVLMNGFLKVFRTVANFHYRDDSGVEAWLRQIMVNEALQHLRVNRRFPTLVADTVAEAEPDPETLPDMGLDAELIYDAIRQLPVGYRTVFNLYVVEGYTHREIAEQLSISENTSKSQLSKARAMLQKQLRNLGYEAVSDGL